MPAARQRMHVTPSETTSRLLGELSKVTGKGQATIVRELLDEASPALEMMLQAFQQLAKRPQEMEAVIHRMSAQAHQTISQATLDLDTNRKPGRKPKQGQGAANTG
jgi:predicted DNA-binding protein